MKPTAQFYYQPSTGTAVPAPSTVKVPLSAFQHCVSKWHQWKGLCHLPHSTQQLPGQVHAGQGSEREHFGGVGGSSGWEEVEKAEQPPPHPNPVLGPKALHRLLSSLPAK